MLTKLVERASEGSTFVIRAEFYENTPSGKVPVIPNAGLTWNLADEHGTIINNREDVAIASAAVVDVVLFGADLAIGGNHAVLRHFTIRGTYDGVAGNDLPLVEEASFQISNLVGEP